MAPDPRSVSVGSVGTRVVPSGAAGNSLGKTDGVGVAGTVGIGVGSKVG